MRAAEGEMPTQDQRLAAAGDRGDAAAPLDGGQRIERHGRQRGIKRRPGMTHDEFVRYQREVHRPLLMAIPEARRYIKHFVVSYPIAPPDYSGPDYDTIVEGWFDGMDDMNALYLPENFLTKVDPDHANFMDLSSYGRIVAEEEVVIG